MAFIAIQEGAQHLGSCGIVEISDSWFLYIYPVKTVVVGGALLAFRKSYSEIVFRDLTRVCQTIIAIFIGVTVFSLWIFMDWTWATIGTSKGFNPMGMSDNLTRYILVGFRLFGASVVVPIMEELFWRSWLLRYLISNDFQSVPVGTFTYSSFIIGAICFGLEHNLWVAGIMAGSAYSLLLYRSKSIAQCIAAHAVTNFLLGIYVLQSGKWEFW